MAVTQATDLADFSSGIGTAGAILEVDNTNNRIGIGTTNPSVLLDVDGDVRITGILTVGSSSLTLDGTNNVVNVGTALTLGHTQGVQFHTQNLHATGFEVNNINASGIITASSANFNGNVSIAGTLTYEDVTNIDSVGLITARSGIHVTGGNAFIGDNADRTSFLTPTANNLQIDGGVIFEPGSGNDVELYNYRTTAIKVGTGGTEKLRITSDGKIGIGTDNPSKTLTVYGDSSSSFRISKSGVLAYDHTFDGSSYTIANNNGSAGIPIIIGTKTAGGESLCIKGNGDVLMGGAGGNSYTGTSWGSGIPTFEFKGTSSSQPTRSGFIGFDSYSGTQGYAGIWSDNGSLQFYTGLTRTGSGAATEKLHITSGGAVNIGGDYNQTTYKTQITGDLLVQKSQAAYLHPQIELYATSNTAHGGAIKFSGKISGAKYQQALIRTYGGSTNTGGSLAFHTGDGTEKLRITSGGDVSISSDGTVHGVSKLTILPANRTTAFSASDGDSWHDVVLKQTGSATNNAVGIAFAVSGDAYHKNAGTGIAAVKNGTNSDYGADLVFITRPQSAVAEERLRITSAGQVSLGNNPTVASDAALHIELDGTREYLRLEGDGGGSNAYLEIEAPNNRRKAIIFKSGGTRRGVIGVGDSDEASATSLFLSASTNIAGNDPHMVITSAGNIGINRTDPDQKLNVNGCAEFNAYDGGNGTGGYYTPKGLIIGNAFDAGKTGTGDDRNAIIWQERGLDLVFATNDTSRMKITSGGLVGIGTHDPTISHGKGLHIADANAGIRIQNTANTGWAYMEYADESNTVKYVQGYRDANGLYGIRPGNSLSASTGLTIDPDGLITTPDGPAFMAYRPQSSWNVSASSVFPFNTVEYNRGGHFSTTTYKFTAPTTAVYQFNFSIIYYAQNFTNAWVSLRKNGSRINGGDLHFSVEFSNTSRWHNVSYGMCLSLIKDDYVEMWNGGQALDYHGANWSNFSGFLVG